MSYRRTLNLSGISGPLYNPNHNINPNINPNNNNNNPNPNRKSKKLKLKHIICPYNTIPKKADGNCTNGYIEYNDDCCEEDIVSGQYFSKNSYNINTLPWQTRINKNFKLDENYSNYLKRLKTEQNNKKKVEIQKRLERNLEIRQTQLNNERAQYERYLIEDAEAQRHAEQNQAHLEIQGNQQNLFPDQELEPINELLYQGLLSGKFPSQNPPQNLSPITPNTEPYIPSPPSGGSINKKLSKKNKYKKQKSSKSKKNKKSKKYKK
jgi:hypothetical protein